MSFTSGLAQGIQPGVNQFGQNLRPAGGNPQNLGGSTPVAANGGELQYDANGNIIGGGVAPSPIPDVSQIPAFNPNMASPGNAALGLESGGPVPGTRAQPVRRRVAGNPQKQPQFMRGPSSGVVPARMQSPIDPGTPMLANGGVVPRGIPQPMAPADHGLGPASYERGGPVVASGRRDGDYGDPVPPHRQPGPALPSGPQQGITPASTEGQILTMDQGGAVPGLEQTPSGFVNPIGGPAPQVSGGLSGFVSGVQQGQVIGHNILDAWHQHEQREIASEAAPGMESTVTGIPQEGQQPSILDQAKNSVEQFFHHLHGGLLDDNHLPNSNAGVQGPYNPTGYANPVPGGPPSPYAAPAGAGIPTGQNGPTPAGASPAQPAVSAAASGASAPASAAQPAGGAVAPGTPPAGQGGRAATAVQQGAQADAVAQASSPAATAGVPTKSPEQSGQPHSLSPDWYEHSEQLKMKAMHDAALAGEDPVKVGAAMDALRTGAVQGQVMRNYAAANAAFMSGDDKSLKQALENVNYYLPNGQGLTFKTATAQDVAANDALKGQPGYDPNMHPGALMYRTPFAGMAGHENDPAYMTVTQQHIGMLAQNALNPSTVQESMLKSYTAQRETQAKLTAAQGALLTGQGRLGLGQAAMTRADVDQKMQPVRTALMQTQGALNLAHANEYNSKADVGKNQGPKVSIANFNQAQTAAAKAVDDAAQGPMTAIPGMVTGPDGKQHINLSPGAGRSVRDPTKASPAFRGMPQEDVEQAKMYASQIAGANIGISNPMEAADAGARIARFQHQPSSHSDPATGKQTPDVMYDAAQNTVHVWDGHVMKNFYLSANIGGAEASPVGSAGGSEVAGGNPADNEPAEESPEQTAGGDAFSG